MELERVFTNIANKYSENDDLIKRLWTEIYDSYTASNRFYHNLSHIENIINELSLIKEYINDWDTILFSTFYHDIVYNIKNSHNEEDSAELAKNRLQQLSYPDNRANLCASQILATKGHFTTNNIDTSFFIDADLSVLGRGWDMYSTYYQEVRKEYSIYSDSLYKRGRTKVLESFLCKERIYITDCFYNIYEKAARENIVQEIKILND